jgi:hypothetical protein
MSAFANLPISRKLMAAFATSGTHSDGTANSIVTLVTSFAIVHVTIGYTTSVCLQRRFSAARGIAGGGVEPETGSERQIIGVSHKRGAMDNFTPWRVALRVEFT